MPSPDKSWGIDPKLARLMLKEAGKPVFIRTLHNGQGRGQHADRAKLLSILNDTTALVQPQNGHGKAEQMPLKHLKLWKSRNAQEGIRTPMLTELPADTRHAPLVVERFFLVSRNLQSVFGGKEVGFTQNIHKAVLYDKANAARSVVKVNKRPGASDVEVMPRDKAHELMIEWHGPPASIPFIPPNQSVGTLAISKPTSPAAPPVDMPSLDIDIDAILRDDGKELETARAEQKKAAQDVRDAQQMLAEAVATLRLKHERVRQLLTALAPQAVPSAPESRVKGKRGALKGAVMSVLTESSRLSAQAIIGKVMGKGGITSPNPENAIKQCLLQLRSDELAERDENQNWSLTAQGREAANKKD